jgi:hypothetical protein
LKFDNWGLFIVVAVICATCLVQTFLQFRWAQVQGGALFRHSGILLTLTLVFTFACVDFSISVQSRGYKHLRDQVGIALKPFLAKNGPISPGDNITISAAELEKEAVLSSSVKRWLRGAVIKVSISRPYHAGAGHMVVGEIHFPNGRIDFCIFDSRGEYL